MPSDNRLSRMLHVLIHMDETQTPVTSDMIARMLNTHAVVVRRTMAGLRDQGLVQSEKGHGGGWTLTRGLDRISLHDVYESLGAPAIFALGLSADHPACLVEQAVNGAMDEVLRQAREALLERLRQITLADITSDYQSRLRLITTPGVAGSDG